MKSIEKGFKSFLPSSLKEEKENKKLSSKEKTEELGAIKVSSWKNGGS
ncbi:MAG: hypothetical protein JSS09_03665 [Verrucomicrobia bacterium]|nr:hypothetical protein [Verrucomicrobiota bacterium]